MVCPGEELILTCSSLGTAQRWIITDKDGNDIEASFSSTSDKQRLVTRNLNMMSFEFALVSVAYDHFESTVSAIVTEEINNTRVECMGRFSRDFVVLTIIYRLVANNIHLILNQYNGPDQSDFILL